MVVGGDGRLVNNSFIIDKWKIQTRSSKITSKSILKIGFSFQISYRNLESCWWEQQNYWRRIELLLRLACSLDGWRWLLQKRRLIYVQNHEKTIPSKNKSLIKAWISDFFLKNFNFRHKLMSAALVSSNMLFSLCLKCRRTTSQHITLKNQANHPEDSFIYWGNFGLEIIQKFRPKSIKKDFWKSYKAVKST